MDDGEKWKNNIIPTTMFESAESQRRNGSTFYWRALSTLKQLMYNYFPEQLGMTWSVMNSDPGEKWTRQGFQSSDFFLKNLLNKE